MPLPLNGFTFSSREFQQNQTCTPVEPTYNICSYDILFCIPKLFSSKNYQSCGTILSWTYSQRSLLEGFRKIKSSRNRMKYFSLYMLLFLLPDQRKNDKCSFSCLFSVRCEEGYGVLTLNTTLVIINHQSIGRER